MKSSHGKSSARKATLVPRSRLTKGVFGRMFRNLPAHVPSVSCSSDESCPTLEDYASNMIEQGNGQPNPTIPSGYTFFGQFVDHDITFDPTSDINRQNDPNRLNNFRTPRFDLDSLYGGGPDDSPFMYNQDPEKGGELLTGKGTNGVDDDLLRVIVKDNPEEIVSARAIIGDPRNDENIFISQLQLGMIKFHNQVVDYVIDNVCVNDKQVFVEAQRLVRWHYQWVVINDFLKRIVGADLLNQLLPDESCPHKPRLCYYEYDENPFIPIEFSVAAYRFGHSMVRKTYVLNDEVGPKDIFSSDGNDFGGFRQLPSINGESWTIEWERFLDIDDTDTQMSNKIDTLLADPLAMLPSNVADAIENENGMKVPASLALLNLRRGLSFDLPSGQAVARAMGLEPIESDSPSCEDPLWFYILNEADTQASGEHLGAVGGRIVAEVFLGLLAGDSLSYLNIEPNWKPFLGLDNGENPEDYELKHILKFAGVLKDA